MKLLVFAHTPPPHHGQSYMVQLMLEGFGGDCRRAKSPNPFGIQCYHVNARFSRGLSDVGEFQGAKIFLIFWFCAQAIWIRFRHGVKNFYYVPAPGKKVALYRDWLVMLLCRAFFKNEILHWHAAGMAKWLEVENSIFARATTYRLFRPVNLSLVLSRYNFSDAEKLLSGKVRVVYNGIPDPCPKFDQVILPRRRERLRARQKVFSGQHSGEILTANLLFLAHCTREKGLFAAITGVQTANRLLAARSLPLRLKLTVAGNFVTYEEQAEFDELKKHPEFAATCQHVGFVSSAQKNQLLLATDLFLFPTRYLGENQPVNLIEAMAFGLPMVTTRWRSLPEMLPPDYPGLVNDQNPEEIAEAVLKLLAIETSEVARKYFTTHFTLARHLASLTEAIRSVEN